MAGFIEELIKVSIRALLFPPDTEKQKPAHPPQRTRPEREERKPIPAARLPTIVEPAPGQGGRSWPRPQPHTLSAFMAHGARCHERTSGQWYDSRARRTCAITAAYVGAYGPDALSHEPSPSEMAYMLSRLLGYSLHQKQVALPVNQQSRTTLFRAVQLLTDRHGWSRRAIAVWLHDMGL